MAILARRRGAGLAAIAVGLAVALSGCGTAERPSDAGTRAPPTGSDAATPTRPPDSDAAAPATPVTVASGLEAPWSIAFYGEVALISERDSGRVLELDLGLALGGGGGDGASIGELGRGDGGSIRELSSDGDRASIRELGSDGDGASIRELGGDGASVREVAVIDGVVARGEGGLLGIAVYGEHLYAAFTAEDENRVERFPLLGPPGELHLGPPEVVIDGIPAGTNHNGGRIAFGPDGMLYVTTGDAGDRDSAQDRHSLGGKILRLLPDGGVPADNPFRGSPVYSLGHRNPQGIAWDAAGTMYASEFGQDTWDELNVIEPGGDYGWPEVEGMGGRDEFIDPVQQWSPADASPSGIAVTDHAVYIANLRGERLRAVPLADLGAATEHFVGEYGRLRDVVVGPDGALWMLTNNTDGRGEPRSGDDRLLRVAPPSR